jgi:spermidine synthase
MTTAPATDTTPTLNTPRAIPRLGALGLLFAVFTLSGFAGLVYESIWSHYLRLFLGHAGYAQTLVLAIFMGGMAAGAWFAGRYSRNWRDLLLGYALVEAVIGVIALAFHAVFVAVTSAAFEHLLPTLGTPAAAAGAKWLLGAALILPQSVLLGMTFPLMSGGLIRRYPGAPGSALAMLYFTNSLGASVGVLVAGFILIERFGLPGTIQFAGALNLALAAIMVLLARSVAPETAPLRPAPAARRDPGYLYLLLAVAALTGAASFIYEIAWIRMLTLVLGSATHSFELMLSAFILGLACGGLAIRRRIDRLTEPRRFLGYVQVTMGLAAIATLPLYSQTFGLMQWTLEAVERSANGYALFHIVSHVLSLAVMFPAAFCAGMTLPLITYALLRRGHGEGAIGAVYAANTCGAIIGVVLAAHAGLPWLGLKGTVLVGAAIDIGLGLALLWAVATEFRRMAVLATGGGVIFVLALGAFRLDAYKMMSGVYRHGEIYDANESSILYYKDGRTASVSLVDFSEGRSIRTNGKSDGGVNMQGGRLLDETTMTLTGALPLSIKPDARHVAVIGIGTGITTHTLLGSLKPVSVDTIEIEPAMVEASRGFAPRNAAAFNDPRSRIHIDDAKTFFSTHNRRYDVIISEPSNPWVSGVSSLFSVEFYRVAQRHLMPDGIIVQWLQLYEFDIALLASVMRALGEVFPDYVIYAADDNDLLVVAGPSRVLAQPLADVFQEEGIRRALHAAEVRTIGDLEVRRIGARRTLHPLFLSYPVPANSDYRPYVDLNAARARFLESEATELLELGSAKTPLLALLDPQPPARPSTLAGAEYYTKMERMRRARYARDFLLEAAVPTPLNIPYSLQKDLDLVQLRLLRCERPAQFDSWVHALYQVATATIPYLPHADARALWGRLAMSSCRDTLPEGPGRWLTLLRSVADRDLVTMASGAAELLENPPPSLDSRESRHYLIAIALAGHLAQGKREDARAIWARYAPPLSESVSLELRLLHAHAHAPQ